MSNIIQFYGTGFPLGSSISNVALQGEVLTAADGSVWLANTPSSAFAYSSTYATCPDGIKLPYVLLPGPRGGLWFAANLAGGLAYNTGSTLYCTGGLATSIEGDSTNGYNYYTSSDDFATSTRRTFPNTKAYQVAFTAGKFIGVCPATTTNGIITGTDGVSWSSVTGISITTVMDIVSDGSNNIVILPSGGTAGASSTDGGATFGATTLTTTMSNTGGWGQGVATWNAGAGLFITGTSTAGQYQTSPTGATWTARATQATYAPYQLNFGTAVRFASDATVTVALGAGGFFATTTDGLTWANHGIISTTLGITINPQAVYHDGTRFVAIYNGARVFYSTNGTSWSEGKVLGQTQTTILAVTSGRLHSLFGASLFSKMILMTDATATTPQTIAPPFASSQSTTNTYWRIK